MQVNHVTLTTGHVSVIREGDVAQGVVGLYSEWLARAVVAKEQVALLSLDSELLDFSSSVTVENDVLMVTVFANNDIPLVTFVTSGKNEPTLWERIKETHQNVLDIDEPSAPWCAVVIHETLFLRLDAMGWLGDFEKCIAWTWLQRRSNDEISTPNSPAPPESSASTEGDMFQRLAVGEPYVPGERNYPELPQYNYRNGQHELTLFFRNPTEKEIEDYSTARIDFAFTHINGVVNLLWKIKGTWNDTPYSPWVLKEEVRIPPPPNDTLRPDARAMILVVLVSARDGIVKVVRQVSFSPKFTRALHNAIAQQIATPHSKEDYRSTVAWIYDKFPTSDALLAEAIESCRGGE